MPLDELSPNVRRRGTTPRPAQIKDKDGGSQNTADSNVVRSMLKTSTETGEIGQFSVRPSRLPRSGSRVQTTRPRSGSFDTSFASGRHHRRSPPPLHRSRRRYGPRPAQSHSSLPTRDRLRSNRSNLASYHHNSHSRMRSYRQFPHGSETIASPSAGPHGLHGHRSLITLRSQQDFNSMHSNSPLAHAARFRGAGRRANSPAFGDAHSYMRHLRYNNQRAGSIGTAASSPVSMFMTRQGLLGYHPDMNGSFSSFIRLPSPAIPPSHFGAGRPYHPSRTTTPASFRDPRAASTGSLASFPRLPKSPTGSTTPAYYDYTESFIEEDCFSPEADQIQASLPFNMDQTILENGPPPLLRHAQTPFGTLPGSSFHPSELPTKHNRRPSEHSRHSKHSKHSKLSRHSPPIEIPKRTSSLGASILTLEQKAELDKTPEDFRGILEKLSENADDRRASIISHRTCASSHSSSFFPNASRSPRDLTSLAARVHSSPPDESVRKVSTLGGIADRSTGGDTARQDVRGIPMLPLPPWQLPTLTFRPLSSVSYTNSQPDQQKTSNVPIRAYPEIISPTPERPMSSQSRKRFSRILEIDDDYSTGKEKSAPIARSYNSLNFSRLKNVDELPETTYPARLSIPPFNPRNNPSLEAYDGEMDIINAYVDARSSQNTNNERSTIESLLNRHIECLGVQPESDCPSEISDCDCEEAETTESKDAMAKPSGITIDTSHEQNQRPATSRSWNYASVASLNRTKMVSKEPFAGTGTARARLVTSESLPCVSEATSANTSISRERPSIGWQTLTSTSQFNSGQSMIRPSLLSGELGDVSGDSSLLRFKLKRRSPSALNISPSSSSCWSEGTEETNSPEDIKPVHKRLRTKLDRTASDRRRIRIRLKARRNSLSLGRLTQSLTPPELILDPTGSASDSSYQVAETIQPSAGAIVELSAEPIFVAPAPCESRTIRSLVLHPPLSPSIPSRWSSIVAGFPQPVQKSMDLARKASVRTVRSHRSNTSLADPINSARLNSQIPRMGSVPVLAPPEFGPPLTTSDLNLSMPYADMPSTIRPTLRETRSFFSDDSSALHGRSGIRKRFHLHSLRSVLPSSPRATLQAATVNTPNSTRDKLDHSCHIVGRKSSEHTRPQDGTVGMSDFAYRKRKVIECLKGWWKRQCVQKKLALRRRKSSKSMPSGVLT